MSWSRSQYQDANSSSVSSLACSLSGTVAVGDVVVVSLAVNCHQNTVSVVSVVDNHGNTYSLATNTSFNEGLGSAFYNAHAAIYFSVITTGSTSSTITVTVDHASDMALTVADYTGGGYAGLSGANNAVGTGFYLNSGTAPVLGTDLVCGLGYLFANSSSWTAGSGYGIVTNQTVGSYLSAAVEDQYPVTSGPIAATLSNSTSGPWAACVAIFGSTPLLTASPGVFAADRQSGEHLP